MFSYYDTYFIDFVSVLYTKIILNFPNCSCYYKTTKILATEFNQANKTSNNMKEILDQIWSKLLVDFAWSSKHPAAREPFIYSS